MCDRQCVTASVYSWTLLALQELSITFLPAVDAAFLQDYQYAQYLAGGQSVK
jgi:hypothetical protein